MANICLYKVLVKGKKKVCLKLLNIMSGDYNEILRSDGTEDEYEILFRGECNWDVDAYTVEGLVTRPYTEDEIDKTITAQTHKV